MHPGSPGSGQPSTSLQSRLPDSPRRWRPGDSCTAQQSPGELPSRPVPSSSRADGQATGRTFNYPGPPTCISPQPNLTYGSRPPRFQVQCWAAPPRVSQAPAQPGFQCLSCPRSEEQGATSILSGASRPQPVATTHTHTSCRDARPARVQQLQLGLGGAMCPNPIADLHPPDLPPPADREMGDGA